MTFGAGKELISGVEALISESYGFAIQVSALDCLIDQTTRPQLEDEHRAAVYLKQESKEEILLGIYIEPSLIAHLSHNNPFAKLDLENIDAFLVLVEEISHFHLIANRALAQTTVSRLELEWQGEVDKVLCAGHILLRQTGRTHFPQLAHLVFEQSVTISRDRALYDRASHYAGAFWYKLIPLLRPLAGKEQLELARNIFRNTYNRQWPDKISSLSRIA